MEIVVFFPIYINIHKNILFLKTDPLVFNYGQVISRLQTLPDFYGQTDHGAGMLPSLDRASFISLLI